MTCRYCRKALPDGAKFCCFCGRSQEQKKHKRGNGQGSAFKRGRTWTGVRPGYQFTDDNGLHRKRPTKGGFATKKEALEWASTNTNLDTHSPKVIELWELYEQNDLKKLSSNRQTAYKIARNRLESIMGVEIHLLTLKTIQGVINDECETFYPARDCKTVLRAIYKKAMASNSSLVSVNLADFIVLPDLEEKEAKPFTEDEVKAFWKLYDKNDYFVPYVLLLCYTGMMPYELMICKKDMVNLDDCSIFGNGAKTKSRKNSEIVFPEFLRPLVEGLLNLPGDKLLHMNKDNFYKEYYACLERAVVRKLPPYSCRHTYGTEAVKLGVHPAVIQKMLRHSTTRTQERYTHLKSEDAKEAVNLLPRGSQVVDIEPAKP